MSLKYFKRNKIHIYTNYNHKWKITEDIIEYHILKLKYHLVILIYEKPKKKQET